MKTRLLFLFLLFVTFVKAQTIHVSGLQSGIWGVDTVFVTDDVIIEDALSIYPGTNVVFEGFYSITAKSQASFNAIGTESDSITFTVLDTTGFYIFDERLGGWNGIRLEKAGSSKFDYCRFQYGKAALDIDQDGGALRIFDCDDVEISNSTLFCNFSREHGGALNAERSKVRMHDCNILNNLIYTGLDTVYFMYGGGLRFINCEVELIDMDFRYNYGIGAIGGALSLDSCAVNIDRCKFEHNYGVNGGGLYLIRSNDWECSISNSLFTNNTSEHFGGGLAISDSSPLVSNLTVVNNHSIGVNCGGIFFYQYSRPIVRNCIVFGNTNEAPLEEPVQIWSWTYDDYAPEFYNCLVQYGFENISNHDVITVYESCLDENPLFIDPENENYRIGNDSPCLDSGLTQADDFNHVDLDKNPRVWNDLIDLGAYEYATSIGVDETAQNENLIHIVGNPIIASSYAEIELEKGGNLFATIYSMDGKLLVSKDLGIIQAGLNRIEIGIMFQSLTPGQYLFVVRDAEKFFVNQVIKQ